MTSCNATITVLLEGDDCESAVLKTLTCNDHSSFFAETSHGWISEDDEAAVTWSDDAPGATPHQDPTPTYRASQDDGSSAWRVTDGEFWQALFRGGQGGHPDPQGAAEAEAARLNGNSDSDWLHIYCRVAERARECERDEARAEADRYRKALEAVAYGLIPEDGWDFVRLSSPIEVPAAYARRVLDGGQP